MNFKNFTYALLLLLLVPPAGASGREVADSLFNDITSDREILIPAEHLPHRVNKRRLYVISGATGAWLSGVYIAHIEPWWSGKKEGFRFKNDWYGNFWREQDKLGHIYGNILLTRFTAATFQFAGVSRRKALWTGFGVSTAFYTALELTDAGFADWGFSLPDYVANLIGAGYPLAQEYWKPLQHFNLKWSYWFSQYYDQPVSPNRRFRDYQPYTYISGDYDGMSFWLSANINELLPASAEKYWPDWLAIAVGYGAKNLPQSNPDPKYRELYFALDYNLEARPGEAAWQKMLKSTLNIFHFPSPGIRITRDGTTAFLLSF